MNWPWAMSRPVNPTRRSNIYSDEPFAARKRFRTRFSFGQDGSQCLACQDSIAIGRNDLSTRTRTAAWWLRTVLSILTKP
jgi:hypothetical protein